MVTLTVTAKRTILKITLTGLTPADEGARPGGVGGQLSPTLMLKLQLQLLNFCQLVCQVARFSVTWDTR